MIINIQRNKDSFGYRVFSTLIAFTFIFSSIIPPRRVYAQTTIHLPPAGTMIPMSASFNPPMIKGISLYADNPLKFDFIIDPGDDQLQGEDLKDEADKLIKYFMASLTIPEDEMWVNLSPYEKDRIIAHGLSQTQLGRDLLAQDYILKQLTASLIYPEDELGGAFWQRVYARAKTKYGTIEVPMNTFNKVWIVPDKANVHVNKNNVFVVDNHLKVMLEEDYMALEHHDQKLKKEKTTIGARSLMLDTGSSDIDTRYSILDASIQDLESRIQHPASSIQDQNSISSEVIREIIVPEIEREVNQGKNFANLRQIFNSMILAAWYKQNLKQSLLGQSYANQNKTDGININDPQMKEQIYNQYLQAFEKGVYNYIKEDFDAQTQQMIPRKYFSGGIEGTKRIGGRTMRAGEEAEILTDNGLITTTAEFHTSASPIKEDTIAGAVSERLRVKDVETAASPIGLSVKRVSKAQLLAYLDSMKRKGDDRYQEMARLILSILHEHIINVDDVISSDVSIPDQVESIFDSPFSVDSFIEMEVIIYRIDDSEYELEYKERLGLTDYEPGNLRDLFFDFFDEIRVMFPELDARQGNELSDQELIEIRQSMANLKAVDWYIRYSNEDLITRYSQEHLSKTIEQYKRVIHAVEVGGRGYNFLIRNLQIPVSEEHSPEEIFTSLSRWRDFIAVHDGTITRTGHLEPFVEGNAYENAWRRTIKDFFLSDRHKRTLDPERIAASLSPQFSGSLLDDALRFFEAWPEHFNAAMRDFELDIAERFLRVMSDINRGADQDSKKPTARQEEQLSVARYLDPNEDVSEPPPVKGLVSKKDVSTIVWNSKQKVPHYTRDSIFGGLMVGVDPRVDRRSREIIDSYPEIASASSPINNQEKDKTPGGIDLNPEMLELNAEGQEIDFYFHDFEMVPIHSLTPVIIQMVPLTNVHLLLGIAERDDPSKSAQNKAEPYDLSFVKKIAAR